MPGRRRNTSSKRNVSITNVWKNHDLYDPGVSKTRVVTRSQAAFCKIKNSSSDLELFMDAKKHQPPNMPHLMVTMKGPFGAIPNTIITHSTAKYLSQNPDLCNKVNSYKKSQSTDSESYKERTRSKSRRSRG